MAGNIDPVETRLDRIEKLVEKNAEAIAQDNLAIARTIISRWTEKITSVG